MYRELLTAGSCRPCKEHSLIRTAFFCQDFKHSLVEQQSIVIVHKNRIRTVMINHIHRDPLAKIRFEAVYTHIQQSSELILVPFDSIRISEIDYAHASLPSVPLPDTSVRPPDQVSLFHALIEQM